ncbi:hypothetical protein FE257_001107 [Aspergillus nanangensis]|uniref:Acyl-CoA desaturase n=1 Tax=Aspergillus nanangensis TaxID=2582783 RepID=A0AAD4GXG9_ASPNN|nr:hypothetical protein FE257_001107 [Aspergillus nanangensis]
MRRHPTPKSIFPATIPTWTQNLYWYHVLWLLIIPVFAFLLLRPPPVHPATIIFTFLYGWLLGLCTTVGYHRLWAHKSFRAHVSVRIFLAVFGAGMAQNSIHWWVLWHRAHHRYVDTELDPYNARKGLLHSHIGWLFVRRDEAEWEVDMSDLDNDPVVVWQDRWYYPLSVFMCCGLPVILPGVVWGDWHGGVYWAWLCRMVVAHHSTFAVNSLAHWSGKQPFSTKTTARDNIVVGLLALGEGYHNFHHEFPTDYRNGVRWFDLDLSKWVILGLAQLGLATNLHCVSDRVIESCRRQDRREDIVSAAHGDVPPILWDDYVRQAKNGRALVAIAGFVYDVGDFIQRHPGGEKILRSAIGTDATATFHGGVYNHSLAANNLLATMLVHVIRGGGRVELLQKKM